MIKATFQVINGGALGPSEIDAAIAGIEFAPALERPAAEWLAGRAERDAFETWVPEETRRGLREAEEWRRGEVRLHFQVVERFREEQRWRREEQPHRQGEVDAAARARYAGIGTCVSWCLEANITLPRLARGFSLWRLLAPGAE
jgi:hypothetical protein